jgi:cell division protein FtsB
MKRKSTSSRQENGGGSRIQWTNSLDLKGWFWISWFSIIVAFAIWSWQGENGFQQVWKLRSVRKSQERENQMLHHENDMLRYEIRRIQNDPDFLEFFARERLGMIGENERLYVFQE